MLGSRVVGGFLREGWVKAGWIDGGFRLQLHPLLWMPLDAENGCNLSINGCDETVAFRRDEHHPNRYRATLALRSITGRATGLTEIIDVEKPVDLELRPDTMGRYRESIHWRGYGSFATSSWASTSIP